MLLRKAELKQLDIPNYKQIHLFKAIRHFDNVAVQPFCS